MIYLNFLHSPSGGGLQNAVSFLKTLVESGRNKKDFSCFVFEGSILQELCLVNEISYYSVSNNTYSKVMFELFAFRIFNDGDVVFSIFGPPFFFTEGKTINIGGMAISNVFYPNVDFWGYLPFRKRIFKKFKDRYRVYRYKKLDYWIFETKLLRDRAVSIFNFPEERTSVVKMAPSTLVSTSKIEKGKFSLFPRDKVKVLLLCGAHPNKRHHLLPSLAKCLKDNNIQDVQFIFTTTGNEYLDGVNSKIEKLGVDGYFLNIGPVLPPDVASVISSVDFVMNISVLESFSNNFVEAWAMDKPLITVATDWAQSAAEKAALYVNIEDEIIDFQSFLDAIYGDVANVVFEGRKLLASYPTPEEKNRLYLNEIERAVNLGSIDVRVSKGIIL